MIDFKHVHEEHKKAINSVFEQEDKLNAFIKLVVTSLQNGGKILWCGNGGSAADAQHMAAELMVRYKKNRKPLASIALTTDTSLITAHANDFEYETVFSRQVEALGNKNDVLISMSTSGSSKNVVLAQEQAIKQGMQCVALIGKKASILAETADLFFQIDSEITARIQEGHTLISHLLCEGLDFYFD